MQSSDAEVIRCARSWLAAGEAVFLVTVAKSWGSSPRPPGSLLAVQASGRQWRGSVSGGCVEEDLLGRLRREPCHGPPRLLCYGTSRAEAQRFGLPCGGRLELVVEPLRRPDTLLPIEAALRGTTLVRRRLDLRSGRVAFSHPTGVGERFAYDGLSVAQTFGPVWKLLIVGAGHIAGLLSEFASALDFQVTVCDPRVDQARNWQPPAAALVHQMPDDAVRALADPRTAVVTLSHDPKLDDMALLEALVSPAFYVGALGSRRSSAARRERLRQMDLPEEALGRLQAPVGLPIGGKTPAEIALSAAAAIVAARNGALAPSAAEPVRTGPGAHQQTG